MSRSVCLVSPFAGRFAAAHHHHCCPTQLLWRLQTSPRRWTPRGAPLPASPACLTPCWQLWALTATSMQRWVRRLLPAHAVWLWGAATTCRSPLRVTETGVLALAATRRPVPWSPCAEPLLGRPPPHRSDHSGHTAWRSAGEAARRGWPCAGQVRLLKPELSRQTLTHAPRCPACPLLKQLWISAPRRVC